MTFLPSQWLSDPAWLSMDATARGFHAHLLMIAAQQEGCLPDDDALWRQWLGLPAAGSVLPAKALPEVFGLWLMEGTPDRLAQLGGHAFLVDFYWTHRWGPMLRRAWSPSKPGWVSCVLAERIVNGTGPLSPPQATFDQATFDQATSGQAASGQASPNLTLHDATPLTPSRKKEGAPKKKAGPRPPNAKRLLAEAKDRLHSLPLEQVLSYQGPRGEGTTWILPVDGRLLQEADVTAAWHVPVNRTARLNIWSVGLALLSTGPGEENKNRSFLSSMIQKYGERKVSAAVGELGGRSVQPADPRAFLRSILRRETEGGVAAQRARTTRAGIPL